MQITRAKATALLNKGEMQLYDDSRHNPVRGFTPAQLESRIVRARSARDRARDLLRRQKLASRDRTGSKRGASGTANQRSQDKLGILADILERFETRLKEVGKAGNAVKKAAKRAAGKTANAKGATRKEGQASAGASARAITPKQALRRTRKVLETKQELARRPPVWQDATGHGGQVASDGFQSGAAARRAGDLHAAESRQPAIHGSIGTRGRINQGKRDSKGGDGD